MEFAEYRKYVAGDDTRRLDWKAYARSDRYYIKEFEADTNLRAYIVMDLLKGAPVYEAMLEKMLPEEATDEGEVTLIEIPVSDKIAGKQVHELKLAT